ncbi:LysR family transcriptional regulator [Pseudochelatococcus sp. B33]
MNGKHTIGGYFCLQMIQILMDSRFLETFTEVVRLGSLAEAARYLGITPAAVAQRMQALEADIGAPLLLRVGRTVRPTEAGMAILDASERVLHEIRQMRSIARTDSLSGELRLGAITTSLTGLITPALRWLRAEAPELDVFLLPGTSPELHQHLCDSRIDAAILVRPPFEITKSYEWQPLRHEPYRLICPADMRVDDILDTIRNSPFIRYDRNNWGGRQLEAWLRQHDLAPREWVELDSLEAIAVMVDSGLGIAIIPEWSRPWPEGLNLQILDIPGAPTPREIGLLWSLASGRRRMIQGLLLTAFGETLPCGLPGRPARL